MLRFNKRPQSSRCDAVVRQIAERSAAATLSRLSGAAERMSIAELRGYVRAHAWPLICAEVQRATINEPLPDDQFNHLLARALEQTVHMVTSAYTLTPISAVPTPHIGLRAAA